MRPDVGLESPGGAALPVQAEIDLGDTAKVDEPAFLRALRGIVGQALVQLLAVDAAIDDDMADMDAPRARVPSRCSARDCEARPWPS